MTNLLRNLFGSSVGKKFLMAASGGILVLFVIAHLAGNLQIFLGRKRSTATATCCKRIQNCFGRRALFCWRRSFIHIWAAISLSRENTAARPVAYAQWKPTAASYASRTMLMSGLIVAFFYYLSSVALHGDGEAVNLTGKDLTRIRNSMTRRGGMTCIT